MREPFDDGAEAGDEDVDDFFYAFGSGTAAIAVNFARRVSSTSIATLFLSNIYIYNNIYHCNSNRNS